MSSTRTTLADICTAGVVLVLALAIGTSAGRGSPEPLPVRRASVPPEREPPAAERLLSPIEPVALAAARELSSGSGDPAPYLVFAERRGWRGEALAQIESVGSDAADAALLSLVGHDDERVAAQALLALARRAPERALVPALRFLERPAGDVQDDALRAAAVLRDPALVPALRRISLDAAPAARDLALAALARTGDTRAADSLRWAAGDADTWDRLRIAESMVRAEVPGAVDQWCDALLRLTAADRAAAIRALRGPVPASIVAALRDLEPAAPEDVRREIGRTLARAPTPLDSNAVRARVQASVTSFR